MEGFGRNELLRTAEILAELDKRHRCASQGLRNLVVYSRLFRNVQLISASQRPHTLHATEKSSVDEEVKIIVKFVAI